ncbi:MAG TPA: FtsX-like permease family protein [Polyangia bacterium]|jgi:putative ABC transport system permease protein
MAGFLRITATLLWREAGRAVTRNRLRSALTSLGIAIGTAAVVCVVAVGRAGSARAQAQLQELGDSVNERTHEIGVRLAVGATGGDIRLQFLGEAILLSFFGGLVGIVLGVAGSYALGYALGWPVSIPPRALGVAPVFAVLVGVFFGFYPAHRAARLDPITALRHE